MKEISCEIIRDLLPLYVDEAVSEETKEFVEEHLFTKLSEIYFHFM